MTNARRMLARAPYFIVDDLSLLDLHEKRRSHQTVQQWHVFTLFWKLLEKPKWPPFMTISILAQEVNSSMDSSILEKKLYLFAANILVHIPPFIWTFGCIPVGMASSVDFNSFFTFLLQFSPHGHYSIIYLSTIALHLVYCLQSRIQSTCTIALLQYTFTQGSNIIQIPLSQSSSNFSPSEVVYIVEYCY